MAGHSKWANIQHRKGAQDKKRAKIFSKCARAIITAVKEGGPDPDQNLRLKYAIDKAKAANMPRDRIERAIRTSAGDSEGDAFEEVVYEGYGPSGVAVMVEALTDNRNRTAPELRKIFEKHGGNLGASGCVAHGFRRRALFTVPRGAVDEDRIMELSLECGAEDVTSDGEVWEIVGQPEQFSDIRKALEDSGLEPSVAEVTQIPDITVAVQDESVAAKVLALMEALDDHDDVQRVHSNFDIPEEIMERIGASA